jgi:glycosyltransferase involved in cell wall biosynthesis
MAVELSVIIPAYNEKDSIVSTYEELKQVLSSISINYEIIFVDDGSTDGTGDTIRDLSGAKLINHCVNRGYGAALKTGIKDAHGHYILITDADGTYPNLEIPRLLAYKDDFDMVVGARTGKNVKIQLYRKPAKKLLTMMANFLSGTNIPDLNSGMRIFKKRDVIKFFKIIPDGFSFTTTITLAYYSSGLSIKYLPINYHARTGRSKIKPVRDGFNFILLILRSVVYFNPLKVFLPASALLFISSAVVALYSIIFLDRLLNTTTTILFISSIQIAIFGLLADLIVRRSN